MGQPVAVVEKPSTLPGIVRFEANRTLTGMGHERFASAGDAVGPRPAAELARRLFATGKVDGVHIYANVITVDLAEGSDTGGLGDVVRDLHKYWMPGMEPPVFEEQAEQEPSGDASATDASAGSDAASSDAAGVELSEAAKRVPADLLERSRLARERWKAKQG